MLPARSVVQRSALLFTLALLGGCAAAPPKAPAPVTPPPPEPTPVEVVVPPPRIALVLGGGAAKGFAHVGVIKALESQGVKVDLLAGTSAGSMVAALYAAGYDGFQLQRLSLDMKESMVSDWSLPNRGFLRGEALQEFVNKAVQNRPIEKLDRKLGIVATDLDSGQGIVFRVGDTGVAVRASSAVPAVFQPVRIGTREYVDGGLVAPVPVRYARQMGAQLVIAVDISEAPDGAATGDAMRMLLQTFSIMGRSINQFELAQADIVIRPKLAGVSGTDFSTRTRSIQAGRDAATALLGELRLRILDDTR